ncbi:hypothetical protein ILYODFUR_003229 [Ilyodon furcidens]|uniref:Uncharacterized protein n=1 Tax=Ilyodon furcidens TaxID=33524 RepID=A0ABV0V2R1_9TELE
MGFPPHTHTHSFLISTPPPPVPPSTQADRHLLKDPSLKQRLLKRFKRRFWLHRQTGFRVWACSSARGDRSNLKSGNTSNLTHLCVFFPAVVISNPHFREMAN